MNMKNNSIKLFGTDLQTRDEITKHCSSMLILGTQIEQKNWFLPHRGNYNYSKYFWENKEELRSCEFPSHADDVLCASLNREHNFIEFCDSRTVDSWVQRETRIVSFIQSFQKPDLSCSTKGTSMFHTL